jgi:hypothetical protein
VRTIGNVAYDEPKKTELRRFAHITPVPARAVRPQDISIFVLVDVAPYVPSTSQKGNMVNAVKVIRIPKKTSWESATLLFLSDPMVINMQKVGIYSYGHSSKNAIRFSQIMYIFWI